MRLLDTVLEYHRFGLRPIPLRHDGVCGEHWKRPDASKLPKDEKGDPTWIPYQTTAPTEEELHGWFENDEEANVGSVIPQGVLIVDFDGGKEFGYAGAKQAEAMLLAAGVVLPENAPRVKTGNGYQIYLSTVIDYKKIPGDKFLNNNGEKPFVEILTNGCYGILPPSTHFSGRKYEWIVDLEGGIPPAPQELIRLIEQKQSEKNEEKAKDPDWVEKALMGASSGNRNTICTSLAGYFIAKGLPEALVKNILESTYAKRCNPPMINSEVADCVKSIASTDARNNPKEEMPEGEPRHISVVGKSLLKSIADGPPKFYSTSFSKLDFYLGGGFVGGELAYLGARPGVGKTAMALQIARHIAISGTNILIVSREMNNRSLMSRLVAQTGAVTAGEMRRMNFQPDRLEMLGGAVKNLSELPIFMTDKLYKVEQVADVVAKSKAKENGLMVIIDYLQLMRAGENGAERRIQVETVSQELKKMALENDVPILCMSSLSRAFDKKNPKPTTDSLRESGALEHDADVILLLHRGFQETQMECQVAKNRNGHTGSMNLVFEPEFLAFSYLEERTESAKQPGGKTQDLLPDNEPWDH